MMSCTDDGTQQQFSNCGLQTSPLRCPGNWSKKVKCPVPSQACWAETIVEATTLAIKQVGVIV